MAFLYVPILLLVVFSFNSSRLNIRWEGFSTQWYEALLSNQALLSAFQNSLIVAGATTVLSTLLGTLGAWMLYRYRFPFQHALGLLIFIPMVMPEVLMGVSLLVLFVQFLHIPLGFMTMVIAHTTFCFPLSSLPCKHACRTSIPFKRRPRWISGPRHFKPSAK